MKPDYKYDFLIFGGGIAEFIAAIILQKYFKKKTAIVTGLPLSQEGNPPFDFFASSLYAGQMEYEMQVRKLLNWITNDALLWERLPSVYERHFYPGKKLNLSDNLANYMDELKALFPKEKGNVDLFFRDIQHAANYTSFFLLKHILPGVLHGVAERFFASGRAHASEALEKYLEISDNIKFKTILSGQLQNLASCRTATAFTFQSMNMMSFLNGAYSPIGGARGFYNALKSGFLSAGGALYESRIKEIFLKTRGISGVEVEFYAEKRGFGGVQGGENFEGGGLAGVSGRENFEGGGLAGVSGRENFEGSGLAGVSGRENFEGGGSRSGKSDVRDTNGVSTGSYSSNGSGSLKLKASKYFWGLGVARFADFVRNEERRKALLSKFTETEKVPYPVNFLIKLNNKMQATNLKGEVLRFFPDSVVEHDEITQGINLFPYYPEASEGQLPSAYIAQVFISGEDTVRILSSESSKSSESSESEIAHLREYISSLIAKNLPPFFEAVDSVSFIPPAELDEHLYFNPYGTIMPSVSKATGGVRKNRWDLRNLYITGADFFIPGVIGSVMSGAATVGMAVGAFSFFRFFRYLKRETAKKPRVKIKPLKYKK
ncbi:MAG: hypothetical protein LC102_12005 [Ignavibacteriales bacterium]|nr:hypothetical protein [Ignavibacteriaceae bacterium]MBW7873798.1 hypothetical protein [Ignavibacteria bacterium]MCZ2144135.1 hypothetical protein [Ignavibacteriales bacterium]WKZ72618.1 MAG: hypothetical protein QY308_00120 [Ignavibacteriaceae bacterium]